MATKFHLREKLVASLSVFVLLTIGFYSLQQDESDSVSSGVNGTGEIAEQTVYDDKITDGSATTNQPTRLKSYPKVSSLKTKPSANPRLPKSSVAASVQLPNTSITPRKSEPEVFFGYLRLVGTTVFGYNPRRNKAVIEDLLTSRQKLYAVGAVIPYGAKIIRIQQKGIVLEKQGVSRHLALAEKLGNPGDVAVLSSKGYKRVAENEWLIRPNSLIGDTENIYELLKQVSIRPYIDAGKIKGFSVSEMEQGALFNELGLKGGDVISSVNGETIDSLSKAYEVYQRIRRNPMIKIGLNRGQQEVALAYYMIPDGPPKYSVKQVLQSASMTSLFDQAHP